MFYDDFSYDFYCKLIHLVCHSGSIQFMQKIIQFNHLFPGPSIEIKFFMFSNKIDDNGVLIRASGDKPGYFAVGFQSEKSDKTYRYVWLYKVRAKPVTENYATKEGTTITRQTGEVEWTAIKRTSDGRYQAVADEGQNGFTAEKAKTFLDSVYEPAFSAA